jgi:hypothetical protein
MTVELVNMNTAIDNRWNFTLGLPCWSATGIAANRRHHAAVLARR